MVDTLLIRVALEGIERHRGRRSSVRRGLFGAAVLLLAGCSGSASTPGGTGSVPTPKAVDVGTAALGNETACVVAESDWCVQLDTGGAYTYAGLARDTHDNLVVAGLVQDDGQSSLAPNVYVAKSTIGPQMVWIRRFGTAEGEEVFAVATGPSDEIVVAGSTTGSLGAAKVGYADAFVAKLSAGGDLLWVRQLGTPGASIQRATTVAVDAAGDVVVAGSVGTDSGFLATYTSSGSLIWLRQWSEALGAPTRLAVDAGGAIVVAGDRGMEMWTAEGDSAWFVDWNLAGPTASPTSLVVARAGGDFLVTLASAAGGGSLFAVAPGDGSSTWSVPLDSGFYTIDDLRLDGDGNAYVVGMANDFKSHPGYDGYLEKLSPTGDRLSGFELGVEAGETGFSVVSGSAGGPFVTGPYFGPGVPGERVFLAHIPM